MKGIWIKYLNSWRSLLKPTLFTAVVISFLTCHCWQPLIPLLKLTNSTVLFSFFFSSFQLNILFLAVLFTHGNFSPTTFINTHLAVHWNTPNTYISSILCVTAGIRWFLQLNLHLCIDLRVKWWVQPNLVTDIQSTAQLSIFLVSRPHDTSWIWHCVDGPAIVHEFTPSRPDHNFVVVGSIQPSTTRSCNSSVWMSSHL